MNQTSRPAGKEKKLTQEEINRLWAEEAERRVAQIEAGEVELAPGEKVFAKLRKKYGR